MLKSICQYTANAHDIYDLWLDEHTQFPEYIVLALVPVPYMSWRIVGIFTKEQFYSIDVKTEIKNKYSRAIAARIISIKPTSTERAQYDRNTI